MAITKIHAIKSTIAKSIDYICNPNKTNGESLLSFNACSNKTAEYDFRFALERTKKTDKNLAYHLIQSFKPGEVSDAKAHEIGEELAREILGNKYSYVIATHNDRGHVHNHIIFCAADNIEHKKYHDCRETYYDIRRASDMICMAHGLSIVSYNKKAERKSHSRKEWQSNKDNSSWKNKLKIDINECLEGCLSYQDFINNMKKKGYEIKNEKQEDGKYISYRPPGKERWIRGRDSTLGYEFTREGIIDRISNNKSSSKDKTNDSSASNNISISNSIDSKIHSTIDTSSDKFKDNIGLRLWAEKENLKALAHNYTLLRNEGYESLSNLNKILSKIQSDIDSSRAKAMDIENELDDLSAMIQNMEQYLELKPIYDKYRRATNKEAFLQKYEYELTLFEGAREELKDNGVALRHVTNEMLAASKDHFKKLYKDELAQKSQTELLKAQYAELYKLKSEIDKNMTHENKEQSSKEQSL